MVDNAELIAAAESYHELGIPVLAFKIGQDGKKKPYVKSWEDWKERPQTPEEYKEQISRILATRLLGVVTGTPITKDDETYHLCIVDRDTKDPSIDDETKAKSKIAINSMRLTRIEGTMNKGQHLIYLSKQQVKGKKLNKIGMELLALGNLAVMFPSEGYTRINDNIITVVDNAEDIFYNGIERAGLAPKRVKSTELKALEKPSTYRRREIRPCFNLLMKKEHLEHLEKVALIYELHYCGRTDQEITELFHDNEAWEPAPKHAYNQVETDEAISYTIKKAQAGKYRYLKATLAEIGICQTNCPFIKDVDCRKSSLKGNEQVNPIADVAKPIEQKYRFVVEKLEVGRILYVYDESEGIYTSETEAIIKKEICELLDDDTREKFYKEVVNWITFNSKTPRVNFNEKPELLAFKNCVLNLLTKKQLSFSPDFYITNKIPHNYNPNANKNGKILKFIEEIMGEKKYVLQHQEFMGQALYRNITSDRFAPVLVGEGNNGKSVLVDADTFILGKKKR